MYAVHASTISSPSRTYIALCNGIAWDQMYFLQFTLPEGLANNVEVANRYFTYNNCIACWDGIIPIEHYRDIQVEPVRLPEHILNALRSDFPASEGETETEGGTV